MRWLARFAGWSALLAIPAWLMMPAYQPMLGKLASQILRLGGLDVEFSQVMLSAPMDLALFAAMCLASLRAPRGLRFRALGVGLPLLIVGEGAVMALVVLLTLAVPTGSGATSPGSRVGEYLIESIPWVNAAVAWLVLLGPREFPELRVPETKRNRVRMVTR